MSAVYITGIIPKIAITLLAGKGFSVEVNSSQANLSREMLKEVFGKYDAVVTLVTDKIDKEVLAGASPNLKIIANFAVGFDNIDIDGCRKMGLTIANTPGVAGESVAEHTFALIFACRKRLLEADRYVRDGKFKIWDAMSFLSPQLWGSTIGIIGLGRIGTFVGHIAYGGFRMNILYFDITRAEDFELLTEAKFESVDYVLKNADVLSLHVPLNSKTHHLIGREQLKVMKNSAILINTSRGPVVDEVALVEALKTGEIAAAGLDVFENEPNISPELIKQENVILTPHIASATIETREAMARITAQNIIDFFDDKTPFGLVKV